MVSLQTDVGSFFNYFAQKVSLCIFMHTEHYAHQALHL